MARGAHTRTARFRLIAAALVFVTWSFNAWRFAKADAINVAAVLAAVSLVVVGLALGAFVWQFGSRRRAAMTTKQRDDIARARPESVLIMMALLGMALGECIEGSVGWWRWDLLVASSIVAGVTWSVALLGTLDDVRRGAHTNVVRS